MRLICLRRITDPRHLTCSLWIARCTTLLSPPRGPEARSQPQLPRPSQGIGLPQRDRLVLGDASLSAGPLRSLSRCNQFCLGSVQQVAERIGALAFAGERLVQPIGARFSRPSISIGSVRTGFCSISSSFRSFCAHICPVRPFVRPSTRVALDREQCVQLDR
jgi:hypothetical protein